MFVAPKTLDRSGEGDRKSVLKRERLSSEEITSPTYDVKSAPKKPKRELTFSTPIKLEGRYLVEAFMRDMADVTAIDIAEEILKGDTWHCLITELVDGTCRAAEYVADRIATLEREKLIDALLDTSDEGKTIYSKQ